MKRRFEVGARVLITVSGEYLSGWRLNQLTGVVTKRWECQVGNRSPKLIFKYRIRLSAIREVTVPDGHDGVRLSLITRA